MEGMGCIADSANDETHLSILLVIFCQEPTHTALNWFGHGGNSAVGSILLHPSPTLVVPDDCRRERTVSHPRCLPYPTVSPEYNVFGQQEVMIR
jgi:hypothetical protein